MLTLPVGGVWGGANGLTHREHFFLVDNARCI